MGEKEVNENMQITNNLLLDMVHNQKEGNKNLSRAFVATVVCLTAIIITMIIGYFVYESQFEVIDKSDSAEVMQEADNQGSGNIIMNNSGDLKYGESETSN